MDKDARSQLLEQLTELSDDIEDWQSFARKLALLIDSAGGSGSESSGAKPSLGDQMADPTEARRRVNAELLASEGATPEDVVAYVWHLDRLTTGIGKIITELGLSLDLHPLYEVLRFAETWRLTRSLESAVGYLVIRRSATFSLDRLYDLMAATWRLQAPPPDRPPPSIDYAAVAAKLREQNQGMAAALVEFMAPLESADWDEVASRVHGDPDLSEGAVQKNVWRTQKLLHEIEPRLFLTFRLSKVFKRELL